MQAVLLVIHLLVAIALVVVVLLQRSEGGALGIGGGGGMSGFMTGRSAANVLTKTTAILAALFLLTSIVLAKISGGPGETASSVVGTPATEEPAAPAGPSAPVE